MEPAPAPAPRSDVVLRSPATKTALKEKFVAIYQALFNGEDPAPGRGDDFWDEVFLLKVNAAFLERCIVLTSEESLLHLARLLHTLLSQCVRALTDTNLIRVTHSLQTMAVLFKHVFRKKFTNFGFDVLNICGGFERGDALFKALVANVVKLLNNRQVPLAEKGAAVSLLAIFATGVENINENSLMEYLYRDEVFDALLNLFSQVPTYTPGDGAVLFTALFVCMSLVNYQKYETSRNPFTGRLAAYTDVTGCRALCACVADALNSCWAAERQLAAQEQPQEGLLASWGLWGGRGGAVAAPVLPPDMLRARQGAALLALYEIAYCNKDFFLRAFLEAHGIAWDRLSGKKASASEVTMKVEGADLLRQLVQLSSVLFLTIRDVRTALHAKIAMLLWTVLCEDESLMDCLHDPRFSFKPPLTTLRKSKTTPINVDGTHAGLPPIMEVLDVLLEFLKNNVHNQLQVKLHWQCLAIFHRVLCFQKANHLCLKQFKWDQLWKQMFRLLAFLSRDEWLRKPEVVELCELITTVFNMFITFGDTFLPSGNDYDFLYYELIRETRTISTLSELIDKYAADSTLALQIENLRLIISHFKARIDQWIAANEGGMMSPEDVLGVIKRNYGSLKLTLLDNLDGYTPYMEQPAQVSFFRQLIRLVIADFKPTTVVL